jgi:hypothetical protein
VALVREKNHLDGRVLQSKRRGIKANCRVAIGALIQLKVSAGKHNSSAVA